MKIRNGFVSNSSSSSFIVASKSNKIYIEIDLNNLDCDGKYGFIAHNKEDFIKKYTTSIMNNYCVDSLEEALADEDYPFIKKEYDKALKALENGYSIYRGSVYSDSDNAESLAIYQSGFDKVKDIVIISDIE